MKKLKRRKPKSMKATEILRKAITCEGTGHVLEAQSLYEEEIDLLENMLADDDGEIDQEKYMRHLKDYEEHLSVLRRQMQQHLLKSKLVNHIQISENSRGHSYEKLFGQYLNNDVREVHIYEPYLMDRGQFVNFINFLELLTKSCSNLRFIRLFTKKEPRNPQKQVKNCRQIRTEMANGNIDFNYKFDDDLHDRKILLSNGFLIRVGRGLHIYKPNENNLMLGLCDYDFRRCRQTEVDIWRSKPFREQLFFE